MASFRLRVAIPAAHLGCDYEIGCAGDPSFFYKHFEGDLDLAKSAGPFVYDVVNDHFSGRFRDHYQTMCGWAERVTCASETMADIIKQHTGMESTVIPDPYENPQWIPQCEGRDVVWFGHAANIPSLKSVIDGLVDLQAVLTVVTNLKSESAVTWTQESERRALQQCAVALLTGNSPGASANRVIKAIRAGRFVVTNGHVPSWDEFRDYIWIGDVREGIEWAFNNREEACAKTLAGQEIVKEKFSPQTIAMRWMEVFASISGRGISDSPGGLPLTTPTATAPS